MKFKEVYSNLYNSAPFDMEKLKESILMNINSLYGACKITCKIVKDAACKLKPGKSDITGSFTSDAILNGPDELFDALAVVFRSFLIHGTVTKSLLVVFFFHY